MSQFLRYVTMSLLIVLGFSAAMAQEPRRGGELVIALESEPPNLDLQWSALNYIRYIGYHISELLFTTDADFQTVPMLAEGYDLSDDGTLYTIRLRPGITFHNGQPLTADDVKASLDRWMARSGVARSIAFNITSIEAVDDLTIEIRLVSPMGFVITALGDFRQGPGIYPRTVIEAAGNSNAITEYIGTGPYQLSEWRRGEFVLLERFDGYVPRAEEPTGYGGRREAYLDRIRFVFVPEPSVRAVGIQAGDFQFAWPISTDDYPRLSVAPNLVSVLSAPRMIQVLLNHGAPGATSNPEVRKAIQAILDSTEILIGVFGDEAFWRLDPGIMWQETAWWSDVGAELYNQANPARGRELLAAAGYNGEPIRMIVSAPERLQLNSSLIVVQQLRTAGLNIVTENFDVATHRQVQLDPTRWEMSMMDSTYRTHPKMHLHIDPWVTGWDNAEKEALVQSLLVASDAAEALAIWEEIQGLYYRDLPIIKIGDFFDYVVMRTEVKGYANFPEPFFWNVWLDE